MKTTQVCKSNFLFLLLGLFLIAPFFVSAEETSSGQFHQKLQNGNRFYREGHLAEAAAVFRSAQETSSKPEDWAHALYWVIMSELALGDYGSALRDMDDLEQKAPDSAFSRDLLYHRARVYFNQGFFEDALILFMNYNDTVPDNNPKEAARKSVAFFWIGESLYSMGRFEDAEKFFSWVIAKYPGSSKVEVSNYRLDLIKQKKIEAELLALLRWSHEESLRTSEDYQRRIRIYEYTLNAHQRRIAELTGEPPEEIISEIEFVEPVQEELLDKPDETIDSKPENTQLDDPKNDDLKGRAIQLENEIQTLLKFYEERAGGTLQ